MQPLNTVLCAVTLVAAATWGGIGLGHFWPALFINPDPDDVVVSYEDAIHEPDIEFCYTTKIGTVVSRHLTVESCPKQRHVDKLERQYMQWFKAKASELTPHRVVYVPATIECSTGCLVCMGRAVGCTDGMVSAVKLTKWRSEWATAQQMEMGHVLSLNRHGDPDAEHRRPYYPDKT